MYVGLLWPLADSVNTEKKYCKSNINLLKIPAGGRLTSWLLTSVVEEFKLGIAVLQIQPMVRQEQRPVFRLSRTELALTVRPNYHPVTLAEQKPSKVPL